MSRILENMGFTMEKTGSVTLQIGEERFFLRPDFFDLVSVNEVYKALEWLADDREKKRAQHAKYSSLESFAGNPFPFLNDYKAYVAEIIIERAQQAGFEYQFYPFLKPFIGELTAYFGGFKEHLKQINPEKKCLVVIGGVGLGKTFLLRCFQSNPFQSFQFATAKQLEELMAGGNRDEFEKLAYRWGRNDSSKKYFGQERLALMVDDIGTEETVKSFGNESNVIRMLIEHRYERMRYTDGLNLIMTTNMTIDQIKSKYGERAFDRLQEVSSFYVLPAHSSLRKNL